MPNWGQQLSKNHKQSMQKRTPKACSIFYQCLTKKWPKMEPPWKQKRPNREPEWSQSGTRGRPERATTPQGRPRAPPGRSGIDSGPLLVPILMDFGWISHRFGFDFWLIFDAFWISEAVFQAVDVRGAVALCRKLGRPICRNILQYGNPLYDGFPRAPRGGGSATWITVALF